MADCCSMPSPLAKAAPATANCPVCGCRSKRVASITVKSLVRQLPFGMPLTQYYLCDSPTCGVVYFSSDPEAPMFHRDDLLVRVGLKEQRDPIPLCYCFWVTRRHIEDEIREHGGALVAERIKAEVKAGRCACELRNPSGKCCLGRVSRAIRDALRPMHVANSTI